MMRQGIRFIAILAAAAMLIPGGCRRGGQEPDFRVEVRDAKGVTPGSPVKWQGLEIGTVKAAELSDGGVALSVQLKPEFEGKLHSDVRARPSQGFGARREPALQIYGGVDPNVPVLPSGSVIPEAGMVDVVTAISPATWVVLGGILVALLLIVLIARGLAKFLAFAAALIFLICSFWVLRSQFQEHRAALLGPELEARLQELAEDTIHSPEAISAWETIQAEVSTLGLAAKEKGDAVAEKIQQKVDELIEVKAADLRQAGQDEAAKQIELLKEKASTLVDELGQINKTAREAGSQSTTITNSPPETP